MDPYDLSKQRGLLPNRAGKTASTPFKDIVYEAEIERLQKELDEAGKTINTPKFFWEGVARDVQNNLIKEKAANKVLQKELDDAKLAIKTWKESNQISESAFEKAEAANKVLRDAAERIKNLVVGDKLPNWGSNSATYHTRGIIADICEDALSHKKQGAD